MDEDEIARGMAEYLFTRAILIDLMVHQCVATDDPVAEVDDRSKYNLAAVDTLLERRPEPMAHMYLERLESFWEAVRDKVEAHVRRQEAHTPD